MKEWLDESCRAVAPKRLVAPLASSETPVKAPAKKASAKKKAPATRAKF